MAISRLYSFQTEPPAASLPGHHALELNSIHLALTRGNVLAAWLSDVETAS